MLLSNFTPAERVALAGFRLEKLAPQHAEADFAAVRSSADRIRHVFGPDNGWPAAALSFEENLADLQRHAAEFEERRAFNYALFSADGQDYLGCLYLKPIKSRLEHDARRERFRAQLFFWLSEAGLKVLSEDAVLSTLQAWLARDWPWPAGTVACPGRAQSWPDWAALADAKR